MHYREKVNGRFQAESSFWRKVYSNHDAFAEIIQGRQTAILHWVDSLNLPPHSRILEIGCGAGLLSTALARRGFQVQAIDIAEAMVKSTRQMAEEHGVADRVSAEVGDVYTLAFEENRFDLVIAVGVLPWLERANQAVVEMARVIKPGGHLILTTANASGLSYLLDPLKNPLLRPCKEWGWNILARLGCHKRSPGMVFHGSRAMEKILASAKLTRNREMTIGFSFSFCRFKVVPEPFATRLHRRLQRLADQNVSGFSSLGMSYHVLASKAPVMPDSQVGIDHRHLSHAMRE